MGQEALVEDLIDQVLREYGAGEDGPGAIADTWTCNSHSQPVEPRSSETKPPSRGLMGSYSSRLLGSNPRYFAEKIFGKVS